MQDKITLEDIELAKSVFGDKYIEWAKGFFTDLPDDRNIHDEIKKEMDKQDTGRIVRWHATDIHYGNRVSYTE